MTRNDFIQKCNDIEKLIRTEFSFSQEKMADILGISKKTLVEIEKGRSSLGWNGSVVLCTLFSDSKVLSSTFGGEPTDIIQALAFASTERTYQKTMGGHVWWREIERKGIYKIQQNIISQHYRILNNDDER
ncbi:MAG: transcriptional regulator, partial [Firmicutes bacterium]|nr:transcriptional regulator [Bacillota bacterium]